MFIDINHMMKYDLYNKTYILLGDEKSGIVISPKNTFAGLTKQVFEESDK